MFKVESTSASAPSSSGLALTNPQNNNFDFELSFCDDGATDDLFESFASPSAMESGGMESSSSSADTTRVKVEPEDAEVNMSSDVAPESTASSAISSSSVVDNSPGTKSISSSKPSPSTTPGENSSKEKNGNKIAPINTNGTSVKKGKLSQFLY
jgi:hypothetical protein